MDEKSKKRYLARKSAGLCTQCGKQKSVEGKVLCKPCADVKNAYMEKRRRDLAQQYRCNICGQHLPARYIGKVCLKCCEKRNETQRNRYKRLVSMRDQNVSEV